MPLQHTHEPEPSPAPLSTVSIGAVQETIPRAAQMSVSSGVSDAPRYDTAAVKQIIALAEQMQTQHRQTLTVGDIEALGREIGVEPQFVQRALAHMETTKIAPPSQTSRQSGGRVTEVSVDALAFSLTPKQRRLLAVPLVLYVFALPFTLEFVDLGRDTNGLVGVLLYLIVPAVLALYLGGKGKRFRFGALAGTLTGLAAIASILINNVALHHYYNSPADLSTMIALYAATGFVLG